MSEGITGPVTESLSLSPDEVEEIHAVVSAVETERQARQASWRRPRPEMGPSSRRQPSEAAEALEAMIVARKKARAEDAVFVENEDNRPHYGPPIRRRPTTNG